MKGSARKFWDTSSPLFALFCMAKHFNIQMFYFTPQDIDFENKIVKAFTLENNIKIQKTIPLPRIIDNDVHSLNSDERLAQLKRECYFIRPINGMGKQKFYNALLKDGRFKDFLIETHTIESFEQFFSLFERYYNDVILKPAGGVGGIGVARVTLNENQYIINLKTEKFFLKSVDELLSFYSEHFTNRKYLLQPYITSRTRQGNPFDIRIHAQRGAEGKFKIFIYPRIGNADGVVSNFAAGGFSMKIEDFLKIEFGNDWKMLLNRLTDLGNVFPEYYQSFFKDTIFDIGMDVGIQKRSDAYDLKFFEAFTKPGTAGAINVDTVIAKFEYYRYIDRKLREGFIN